MTRLWLYVAVLSLGQICYAAPAERDEVHAVKSGDQVVKSTDSLGSVEYNKKLQEYFDAEILISTTSERMHLLREDVSVIRRKFIGLLRDARRRRKEARLLPDPHYEKYIAVNKEVTAEMRVLNASIAEKVAEMAAGRKEIESARERKATLDEFFLSFSTGHFKATSQPATDQQKKGGHGSRRGRV